MEELLSRLRKSNCKACALSAYRRNIVVARTVGSAPYQILLIGEAPGQSEDSVGIPFYGPSGQLLDQMTLEAWGINGPSYVITNTVFCHPTDKAGGRNREPFKEEVLACMPNLMNVVDTVYPRLYIFAGKVAERYYVKMLKPNITILHPAYLMRTGGKSSPYYRVTVNKLKEAICRIAE